MSDIQEKFLKKAKSVHKELKKRGANVKLSDVQEALCKEFSAKNLDEFSARGAASRLEIPSDISSDIGEVIEYLLLSEQKDFECYCFEQLGIEDDSVHINDIVRQTDPAKMDHIYAPVVRVMDWHLSTESIEGINETISVGTGESEIQIEVRAKFGGGGALTSNIFTHLSDEDIEKGFDEEAEAATDALEAFLLALACEGVDISSAPVGSALKSAVASWVNNR